VSDDPFAPAVKTAARAKIAIVGVAGSGKTYTALQLGRGIIGPEGRICLGDTEGGKSSFYADLFAFNSVTVGKPFNSGKLLKLVDKAVEHKYDLLIIDGISPWWEGDGGVLQLADENQKGDASGGWKTARPHQNAIEGAIYSAPIHIICTVRAKADVQIQPGPNGKLRPVQLGMKPTMSKDMAFVFDFMFYANHEDHALVTTKTRWSEIDGQELLPDISAEIAPAEEMGQNLAAWLGSGVTIPEQEQAGEPERAAKPADPPTGGKAPNETLAPASGPASPASGDDGGLLDAASASNGALPKATLEMIDAKLNELKALKPDADWQATILAKCKEWYSADSFSGLSAEQAAQLIERLSTTVQKVIDSKNKETTNA
jgi:hypothetical protein